MTLYRVLDDLSGAGLAPTVLGEVAFAEGNSAPSSSSMKAGRLYGRPGHGWIALLRASSALALRLQDTQTAAYSLGGLAGASAMLGKGRCAARLFGAAEALRERTGSVIGLATLRELRPCAFSAVGLADPRQKPPGA